MFGLDRLLCLGRCLVGLGIGISAVVVPVYLGEVAPAQVTKPDQAARSAFSRLSSVWKRFSSSFLDNPGAQRALHAYAAACSDSQNSASFAARRDTQATCLC